MLWYGLPTGIMSGILLSKNSMIIEEARFFNFFHETKRLSFLINGIVAVPLGCYSLYRTMSFLSSYSKSTNFFRSRSLNNDLYKQLDFPEVCTHDDELWSIITPYGDERLNLLDEKDLNRALTGNSRCTTIFVPKKYTE